MAEQREHGIAWTEQTWNPVRGCSRVSEGCRHCYAERVAARFSGPGLPYEGLAKRVGGEARWTGKVVMVPEHLADPLRWKRPRRVFVNSMSDLFHEALSDEQIDQVFAVMALAGRHTFQVLTKRAERMRDYMQRTARRIEPLEVAARALGYTLKFEGLDGKQYGLVPWPIPNVWLGVSVEDQKTADERIPHLIGTPAAVRWASYEPALGPVDFRAKCEQCSGLGRMYGPTWEEKDSWPCRKCDGSGRAPRMSALDWIVVGGESGPGAREFKASWARSTVAQCRAAGVSVFVKQFGSRSTFDEQTEHGDWLCAKITGKGGDPTEWPEDLRVREYPATP